MALTAHSTNSADTEKVCQQISAQEIPAQAVCRLAGREASGSLVKGVRFLPFTGADLGEVKGNCFYSKCHSCTYPMPGPLPLATSLRQKTTLQEVVLDHHSSPLLRERM